MDVLDTDHADGLPAPPSATSVGSQQREPYLTIRGLTKSFETRAAPMQALDTVDLDIHAGEFVSVIGPSGCGKSTLLMMLAGLLPSSGGTMQVGGKFVQGPQSDLGIVFQQDALLDWRTALQNILLQAEIRKLDKTESAARARQLLAMVDLDGFVGAYPHELSGGMRQRVSICRALLHRPPLLLMDEPFGALDALTRDQMQIDLLRLCSESRMTVLFVTHSISEAIFLSDRIIVMSPRPGRIVRSIDVDLPRPRRLAMRDSARFVALSQAVTECFKSLGVLREEANP